MKLRELTQAAVIPLAGLLSSADPALPKSYDGGQTQELRTESAHASTIRETMDLIDSVKNEWETACSTFPFERENLSQEKHNERMKNPRYAESVRLIDTIILPFVKKYSTRWDLYSALEHARSKEVLVEVRNEVEKAQRAMKVFLELRKNFPADVCALREG